MLLPCNGLCDEVLFTNLFRGRVNGLWLVFEMIGTVDPFETAIDGEPGGGVEVGLSSLAIESVDFRLSQEDLRVFVPPISKSNGSWLKEGPVLPSVPGCPA